MRVYSRGHRNHSLFVCPAKDIDGASQWKDENGEPVTYNIRFVNGSAEVDTVLGRWLIQHSYAQRTSLILPDVKRLIA